MAIVKPARKYHHQMVHFLRKSFTYADDGSELNVGTIPAGSVIIKPMSGVHVTTVFDAGSTNQADIGYNGGATNAIDDPDRLGTNLALSVAGFVPLDENVGTYLVDVDTNVTVTVDLTGTAATAGAAEVIICYIPDSDD